jgi:phosphoinositide-3-kinase regulatory subunit 4
LRNTARATAKIRACDILLAFSERLTDEAKLDRVLPYLVSLLADKAEMVKVAAIRTVTQLMALVTVVSPVNAHVFPEYILPRMAEFLPGSAKKPSPLMRATYAACLGSLATSASRFVDMVATLRADGSLPTADPETEDGNNVDAAFQGLFDNARGELIEVFGRHTKSLITDNDSFVKRAFLGSVPELCMFFGTADSNDIILSHLNTYLNDRNWQLKCAFFRTIVGIATFLGGTSLEEFILPLMVQALTDPEEHVVQSVIHSFASMAELGLFQRSKIWELVDVVGRFTMHPNIWIREAAAMFLSSSSLFLSAADTQCIVLPLIKPYLKSSITDFSERVLLDNLKKPLSRAVLDLSITWATKVDRGIFWKPVSQLRTLSLDSNSLIPTISAKDLGHHALQKVPKNEEDEQWLAKLRNMGLNTEDDSKLLSLREYIWRLAPLKARQTDQYPGYLGNVIHLRNINITPQTVMFDDQQIMDEPLRQIKTDSDSGERPHTIADALLDASMTIDDSLAKRRKSAYNTHKALLNSNASALTITLNGGDTRSPISPLPLASSPKDTGSPGTDTETRRRLSARAINGKFGEDDVETGSSVDSREVTLGMRHKPSAINLLGRNESSKTFAETGMTSTNAFGKVEGPFSQTTIHPSALAMAKEKDNDDGEQFRFRGAHTYSGNDPSILKMLDAMYVDNYPSDTAEFGPMIAPSSRRKAIAKNSSQNAEKAWRPEGNLVATFSEHVGAARHIAVASDQLFFITGGDDGNVKIWDTGRLERNIAHRSRQTHTMSSRITALCFVEHTHSFVSCSSAGIIHVVRVDCSQGGTGAVRYAKLKVVREYSLPKDEFAVWADQFKMAETNSSVLLIATNRSRIIAIDLRTLKTLYVLDAPVHHGTPTCFFLEKKRTWMLLGTSHGVVNLFDLRFKLLVKSFGVGSIISRISMHPKGRNRWVSIASGMDVLVVDIEKTPPQIREVYHQGGTGREGSKGYEIWPVDDRPESMLGRRFATALESNVEQGVQALLTGTDLHDDGKDSKYGFLITGCGKKITYWSLGGHIEESMTVSGLSAEEMKPTFTSTHPTPLLTLNVEKLARTNPSAPNAAAGASKTSHQRLQSKQSSRSTVISLGQQVLLRNHLDTIQNMALIETPYGMIVSLDRSGVICVFA